MDNKIKAKTTISIINGFREEINNVDNGGDGVICKVTKTPILKEISQDIEYEKEEKELTTILRERRVDECFEIVNRGKLWYDKLTPTQIDELNKWYHDWLDVTHTLIVPEKPSWLDKEK